MAQAQDSPHVASRVTRLEKAAVETMTPYIHGDTLTYQEETYTGSLWRCEGCGLVWTRQHQAQGCESRGHVAQFVQRYAYKPEGYERHGRLAYNEYTRRAVRRDKVQGCEVAS
ncbi:MAG TPA: hypothetical protein VKT83_18000 [bacterium]|nr:hypothetical protein [bacterium]